MSVREVTLCDICNERPASLRTCENFFCYECIEEAARMSEEEEE